MQNGAVAMSIQDTEDLKHEKQQQEVLARARSLLGKLVSIKEEEVLPVAYSFGSLFCILASYFVLLPLREDAGISLGTSSLPALFVASLLVTLLVAPLASMLISRQTQRAGERALRVLYISFASVLLVFYALYSAQNLNLWPSHMDPALGAPPPMQPPTPPATALDRRAGDPGLTRQQRLLRSSFYVYVNVQNLVAISSMWARCADVFKPEAAARLFGFIAAGATFGQLAGSVMAMSLAHRAVSDSNSSGTPVALILASAMLLGTAALTSSCVRPPAAPAAPPATDPNAPPSTHGRPVAGGVARISNSGSVIIRTSSGSSASGGGGSNSSGAAPALPGAAPAPAPARAASSLSSTSGRPPGVAASASNRLQQLNGQLRELGEGFRLILASPYLMLVCGYLLMTYVVGSLMYFQRALVISASVEGGTQGRTAFFATLNTYSAAIIVSMQLFATGNLLRLLGVPTALQLTPFICAAGVAAMSLRPMASSVACVEVVRKVFGYAVNRPAREVLFTTCSRREKYAAKLVIDTVVQRAGDSLAAAAFQVLDVNLALGPSGIGVAGVSMCVLWAVAAWQLGQQHVMLGRLQQPHPSRKV